MCENNLHLCFQWGLVVVQCWRQEKQMITWPRDSPRQVPLPPQSRQWLQASPVFSGATEKFLNRDSSCMKNLNIFSIMCFGFAENINGMVKKGKLAVKWSSFQNFLFKLKSMVSVWILHFLMIMTSIASPRGSEIVICRKEYGEDKRVMDLKGMGTGAKLGFPQSSLYFPPTHF